MKRLKGTSILILAVACFSGLISTGTAFGGAYDQLRGIAGGGSGYVLPVGKPQCVSGCENTDSGNSGDSSESGGNSWIDILRERREQAEQRRVQAEQQQKQDAYNLNEQGNRAYESKNWSVALDFYKKALSKSPQDKVIQQNLKNAESEKNRQDELRRAQSEFRKRMEKLTAIMPVSKPLSAAGTEQTSGLTRAKVPLPGFSPAQWKEYLDAQEVVNHLYARLNREGSLSDTDARTFYEALRRRNELWAMATEQPLTSAERDRLRLSLPVVVNKSLVDLGIIMLRLRPDSQPSISNPAAAKPVASPDRRAGPAADSRSSQADAITNAFVADFFSDKITTLFENATGAAIEQAHGEKMKGRYENLLGIGKVAVKAAEGGAPAAGAETADLIISQMPEPMSARAEHAVEGGRLYSNVAYRALNRFMADAMNLTGTSFDAEAFWKRFNEGLTTSQKGEKQWIQFGE